ncbi:MAG: SHD1 domain-containing protein [Pirellulales bacterium]
MPVLKRFRSCHSLTIVCLLLAALITLISGNVAHAQRERPRKDQLAPVRIGDQVEVKVFDEWFPAIVEDFDAQQGALLRYGWKGINRSSIHNLADIRFPNDEGSWMVWSDVSGKFRIEARLVGRDETHVTLRKEDGTDVRVPINQLSPSLQSQIAKFAGAVKKMLTEAPVRVGDDIEVRYLWTWYPAKVLKVLPAGAEVSYKSEWETAEREFKHKDMRYPNREGPWREWVDTTGKFKIYGRYITHDETHVQLLKEDRSTVRLERAKLSAKLQKELSAATIFTRRPDEVEFDTTGYPDSSRISTMTFSSGLANLNIASLKVEGAPSITLNEGGFEFTVGNASSVSMVEPIGGDQQLVAIGVSQKLYGISENEAPTQLYWASMQDRKPLPGPAFLPDEVILGYSAKQKRLITAEVRDAFRTPTRFCSYRLEPGARTAKPEYRWNVPKSSFAAWSTDTNVEFVGDDQVLLGYGNMASLWDMNARRVVYAIPADDNEFHLSPDGKYIGVRSFWGGFVADAATGSVLGKLERSQCLAFSDDGRYLAVDGHWELGLYSLADGGKSITMQGHNYSRRTFAGPLSVIDNEWICDGTSLWHLPRKLLAWTFDAAHGELSLARSITAGDKLIAVATRGSAERSSVLIGVAKIPHAGPKNAVASLTDDQLYALKRGSAVRIDPSVQEPRILSSIQKAIREAGWVLDNSSGIVITASAGLGPSETKTFQRSRFGLSRGSSEFQETVSVQPWIQKLQIARNGNYLWGAAMGGVPSSVMVREGESVQSVIGTSSEPSYSLFDGLKFPDKVFDPKYNRGLGSSRITSRGLEDQPLAN